MNPTDDQTLSMTTAAYRLRVDPVRAVADVRGADGRLWFRLRLLGSLDTLDGPDETVGDVAVSGRGDGDGLLVEVRCRSSRWTERTTYLRCTETRLEHWTVVRGEGRVLSAQLFGGRRLPRGALPSGSGLHTVVSPNPDHPRRVARSAVEPAVIGVVGEGSEPGVGHWLFTPAPWCYAVCREPAANDVDPPDGEWAVVGLLAPVAEQTFTAFHYDPVTDGFSLRLEYEGHTTVAGEFRTPTVVVDFGHTDPYDAFAAHTALLRERGLLPEPHETLDRWMQPLFCGWGAQNWLAVERRGSAPQYATEQAYDEFLARLTDNGVLPGTVVVDDKWQEQYATCRPDPRKWPDLRRWIARRHRSGQSVLLWWKAWDPEGAPRDACVCTPDGEPVALDPESPSGRALVEDAVRYMLAPEGLDADGFKVDFTARTPSGVGLTHAGPSWGAALLHRLLAVVYDTAKAVKPSACIITHAANPAFADVTDLIRLNDVLMLDAPEPWTAVAPHMSYRAEVVRAACPGVPIDTDGWMMPGRVAWLEWTRRQPGIGVPALYYVTHVDHSGEPLLPEDLAEVARLWAEYRKKHDLPMPLGYS
ncbi:MAG TPA: hypothetical protein VF053_00820 [Streptosporangiales bacterium]